MRAAFLIIAADLIAFALGVVVTLWLMGAGSSLASINRLGALGAGPMAATASGSAADSATAKKAGASQVAGTGSAPAPSTAKSNDNAVAGGSQNAGTAGTSVTAPATGASSTAPPLVNESAAAVQASASGMSGSSAYVLLLGAFRTPANAASIKAAASAGGFVAKLVPTIFNGEVWQAVEIGHFTDRSSAFATAASLRLYTGLDSIVTKSATE